MILFVRVCNTFCLDTFCPSYFQVNTFCPDTFCPTITHFTLMIFIQWHSQKYSTGYIIKSGLPEGRSDQGGRAVELGGG